MGVFFWYILVYDVEYIIYLLGGDSMISLALTCVIYALVGTIFGGLISLLFFRMDTGWKKVLVTFSGTGGSFGVYGTLTKFCGITGHDLKIGLLAIILIFFIAGALGAFFILCRLLKNQDGHNVIRILDVIVGYTGFIKEYYEIRKKEIDSKLNFDELIKKNAELEDKEKKLNEKELKLSDIQDKIDNQSKELLCLDIPINNRIPITKEFIQLLPEYIDGLAKFTNDIINYTNEFCSHYPEDPDEEDSKKRLKSYFLALCTFVITDLFNDGSNSRIRAHVRTLKGSDVYVSLVATYGVSIYNRELTPIPKKLGMIPKAFEVKRSLIKSINPDYDFETSNSTVWEDYMTLTFYNICIDSDPFISMGISVKSKEKYKNLMYFLSFYKIENLIQDNIDKVNQKCNIISTLGI